MGTRGFVGFVVDSTEKIAYNHSDSCPDGLGLDVLDWLRVAASEGTDHLAQLARDLRVVDPGTTATPEDIERLREFADEGVGTRDLSDWYVLLRRTQGNPGAMLQAGVIEDGSGFPADSLFAEYGYIVDLDAGQFEAYVGFQRSPHDKGRFASREGHDGYAPVALAASWPLTDLPSSEAFLAAFEAGEAA